MGGKLLANERSPLLKEYSDHSLARKDTRLPVENDGEDDGKIPKVQLALLCYARSMESIAFFTIFPFINQMIWETGEVKKTDTGFYSGLTESLLAFVQMFFMSFWMRVGNRFGRRRVLAVSLVGLAVTTLVFGFCKTIAQMIISRAVGGFFAGSIVLIRAMFYDISTPKTQARIFSFHPVAQNVGMFVGPAIGGVFSDPSSLPSSFIRNAQIFRDYPYSLATMVSAITILSASFAMILFVEDAHRPDDDSNSSSSWATFIEMLKLPGVLPALVVFVMLMMMALGLTAVNPVFWYTDVKLGGFGFSPFWISVFIAIVGVAQGFWGIFLYPVLHRRIGNVGVLRFCLVLWPVYYALSPILNELLRGGHTTWFWAIGPLGLFLGNSISMGFGAIQVLMNDVAPSPHMVDIINTLALSIVSGVRSVSPAVFASLYAAGVRLGVLHGHLVWIVMIAMGMIPLTIIYAVPRQQFERVTEAKQSDEESS